MGGNAFANCKPPLDTPRLPPHIYFQLRDHYIDILRKFYRYADTPVEGPEKADYGDIDVIVAEPLETSPMLNGTMDGTVDSLPTEALLLATAQEPPHALHTLLKPACTLHQLNSPTTSFAIPHPHLEDFYIQLDVHVCTSRRQGLWMLFKNAHGDIWNLFGTSLRPFGLTATEDGLYVRGPVIEPFDRKRSRIFLTDSPAEVMALMGYSSENEFWGGGEDLVASCPIAITAPGRDEQWLREQAEASKCRQFPSLHDMFAFVARGRFFRKRFYPGRDSLKANDRRRMAMRPAFRRFVDEYVPSLPDETDGVDAGVGQSEARAKVLEEVLEKWNKRGEWLALRVAWERERRELQEKKIAREIKKKAIRDDIEYADAWIRELEGGPLED